MYRVSNNKPPNITNKDLSLLNKMNPLKKIVNFYIFSNIHVAFATFCLTKITLLEIGISESKTAWFVFFSTIISYNIIRIIRFGATVNWYQKWFDANERMVYVLTAIAIIFEIYLLFAIRFKAWLVLVPFALFTIFYVIPLKNKTLRNIPYLKLFLIAISWAGITVLFPLVQNYMSLRVFDGITFLQRFLFVVAITIPFDIRDVTIDSKELKTLPQQYGNQKSKIIGVALILTFLILDYFKTSSENNSIINILIISLISIILLLKANTKQHRYYSAFFVEAIPILWFLMVVFS